MIDDKYHPQSRLAWHIERFVMQKRKEGFIYRAQILTLMDLDTYLYDYDLGIEDLTSANLLEWRNRRSTEGASSCKSRNTILNGFMEYLQSTGIPVHIPRIKHKVQKTVPYLMSNAEVEAFFKVVDEAKLKGPQRKEFVRMQVEYRVLFRLILSCGLRINEACELKIEDVDLNNNSAVIRQSKGDKDRLDYFDSPMGCLLRDYMSWLNQECDSGLVWLFPGKDPNKHMHKTSLDSKFAQLWGQTPFAGKTEKHPTIHSLRHKFVNTKMTQWMEDGVDMDVMMPYLSKYLGHSDRAETYYYYHQIEESMNLVRKLEKRTNSIIPEVEDEEE